MSAYMSDKTEIQKKLESATKVLQEIVIPDLPEADLVTLQTEAYDVHYYVKDILGNIDKLLYLESVNQQLDSTLKAMKHLSPAQYPRLADKVQEMHEVLTKKCITSKL